MKALLVLLSIFVAYLYFSGARSGGASIVAAIAVGLAALGVIFLYLLTRLRKN